MRHIPVMLSEAISFLEVHDGGRYLDLTAGFGGHSSEIIKLNPTGELYMIDRDEEAVSHLVSLFSKASNAKILKMNFSQIDFPVKFDGILADLGVSSYQFDSTQRGFSYRFNSPLDLRMDRNEENTLKALFEMDASEISRIIRENSDEYRSDEISEEIKKRVKENKMNTTFDLKDAIITAKRGRDVKRGLKKTFMALRMFVNRESESLLEMLGRIEKHLSENGRFVIITYHSVEDRIVKEFFKDSEKIKKVEKKVVKPSYQEIQSNKRARSAKMRVYRRVA